MHVFSYIWDNDYFTAQLLIMLISFANTNRGRNREETKYNWVPEQIFTP